MEFLKIYFPYFIILMSLTSFVLFGIDKYKAVKVKWRIKERTLLLSCFLGGALGGLLGMFIFRHKIRKPKFYVLVPLSVVLWAGIVWFLFFQM